jgi:SAM-dependent methyltransferase
VPVNREAARRSGESIGFSFGENWQKYLGGLDEDRVARAQESLSTSFAGAELAGHTFLDLGCGSGVFSLAARRLGADVVSVDVDPASVACAEQLRGDDRGWRVVQQSVLDPTGLPQADRVYSWGVLHHTGAMWEAVERALALVAPGGLACLALYNRPNHLPVHLFLKRTYNRLPNGFLRRSMVLGYGLAWLVAGGVLRRRSPWRYVREYGDNARGMSFWRDVEDWLGGLPFEFTTPDEFRAHVPPGFELVAVLERTPGACNEYLLRRT